MSTEENSKNNEVIIQQSPINNTNNEILNEEEKTKLEYELKMKQIKDKLKNLLKTSLAKNILYLESKTKEHLQILTSTTKAYNDFDKKIKLLTKQVEENKRKKDENKPKMKKIKATNSKKRSKTVQMGARSGLKLNESKNDLPNIRTKKNNYKLVNNMLPLRKSSKSRTKTIDPRERARGIQNSDKKTKKSINLLLNSEKNINSSSNNYMNKTMKIEKRNTNRFNLEEQNINVENSNKTLHNSRTKTNLSKSKKKLNSSANLFANTSKEKRDKAEKINHITKKRSYKRETNNNNKTSNINIPRSNTYNSNNISEKKMNSNKQLFINNDKDKEDKEDKEVNEQDKHDNLNINIDEEKDNILERLEKQREMLQNLRKQREITNLREEEK